MEIAEDMATYYTSKISKIREKITNEIGHRAEVPTSSRKDLHKFTKFSPISREELQRTLSSMNNKTSRTDPIPTSTIRQSLYLLAPILLQIINLSISQNIFPDDLKNALITPILKSETKDPDEFQNYRPISNLQFLSKLLEKVLHCQLTSYIGKYELHGKFQSAYKPDHSCETAIVHIVNEIQGIIESKRNVALVLLDLSSAFDTVDHQLLIDRLEKQFFIGGEALQLITSYLHQRTFSVIIDECSSRPHNLQYGVQQGSILGPLFYSLYTRTLEDIVKSHGLKVHLYADDCSIYFPYVENNQNEAERKLAKCVDDIKAWMGRSFLKLNTEKTSIMLFKSNGSKQVIPLCLMESGKQIQPDVTVKLLGVVLGSSLNFEEFANKKIQTCNFHLRNLRAIKNCIPRKTRIVLVTSLICSTLDYCNSLLICAPGYVLTRLQKVLNKAVRFIFDVRLREHISPYLYSLHILPVSYRVKFKASTIAYKLVNGNAPSYLMEKAPLFKPTSDKPVRQGSGRDHLMFDSNLAMQKSSMWIAKMIIEWNKLPFDLRCLQDLDVFKSKLKTHYFKQAFKQF